MLLHKKNDNREARSTSLNRCAARGGTAAFDAEQEVEADQHALDRGANAVFEPTLFGSGSIERQQRLDLRERPAAADTRGGPAW